MDQEKDYLEMIKDTSDLVAQEKAAQLGDLAVAFQSSERLTNDVEFWRWRETADCDCESNFE